MPVRFFITKGTIADCSVAERLIRGISANYLLADKGYDSNYIVDFAIKQGIIPVIPPRSNRKEQRDYDKELYKQRHFVENAFEKLKRWRGIATRYAKRAASFEVAVQIRCIALWLSKKFPVSDIS